MSLLVVGSIALDSIETPKGSAVDALGGSGVHFSLAAAMMTPVRLVGVIGKDMPQKNLDLLAGRGVDVSGVQRKDGKTFRWSGRYAENMNVRETISVELNVFGQFEPTVPKAHGDCSFVFLANGSPVHQMRVLEQMNHPKFVMLDSMDLWIRSERPALEKLLKRVHALVINDSEARLLTGMDSVAAARAMLAMGPQYVIIKKGEHGAIMVGGNEIFLVPAYPVGEVNDPTGAGDSFAGGVMGWLARGGKVTHDELRRAILCGTVIASFNVEDFGVNRLASLRWSEVENRMQQFRRMVRV